MNKTGSIGSGFYNMNKTGRIGSGFFSMSGDEFKMYQAAKNDPSKYDPVCGLDPRVCPGGCGATFMRDLRVYKPGTGGVDSWLACRIAEAQNKSDIDNESAAAKAAAKAAAAKQKILDKNKQLLASKTTSPWVIVAAVGGGLAITSLFIFLMVKRKKKG